MACMLTMGFTITLDEDASKGTIVAMCEEMASMLGDGNALRPLGGRKGLLNWWRWPGQVSGVGSGMSGKEMRLVVHPGSPLYTGECVSCFRDCFLLGRDEAGLTGTIGWPEDVREETVMELWREDDSVGLRKGRYRTQLACFGDAPRWRLPELEVIREVMTGAGWRVTGASSIRGLKPATRIGRNPRDSRYYSRA